MHTHELSAKNLEWGGVGEILALFIYHKPVSFSRIETCIGMENTPMYILLTSF